MAVSLRTDEGKIIEALIGFDENRASLTSLAAKLGGKWTAESLRRKLVQLDKGDSPVFLVKGGVQYFGVENCKNPGLYRQVERGIVNRWARDRSIARPQIIPAFDATSKHGVWTRPDLILRSRSVTRGQVADTYHSLEVEQAAGFSIVSVYQAHEQARGAHYAWVFFTGALSKDSEWQRIQLAAKERGVGLVHMPKPSAPAAWTVKRSAKRRDPKPRETAEFLARCIARPAATAQAAIDDYARPDDVVSDATDADTAAGRTSG